MLIFKKVFFGCKKLVFGFKYVRFKNFYRLSSADINLKDVLQHRVNKLSNILDCTANTAKILVSKNKSILTMPYDDFVRNATFCKDYFKWSDMIDFPLITTNSGFLHHRYFSFLELGFINVSGRDIFQFQKLLKETPKDLHRKGYYISYNNSVKHFNNFSQDYKSIISCELTLKFKKLHETDCCLQEIKESMNAEFLCSKLNCSLFKVQQLFRKYPPLKSQSILMTTRLLDVLLKDYQMSESKIFQAPSMLSLHYETAASFLSNIPIILGVDILQIANKFPLFLRQPIEKVQQVEKVLRNYNITDQQLLCCPRVLAFSPLTVKKRLEFLCNMDSFSSIKSQTKFLWLLYHNNNLLSRLEALRVNEKNVSINVFMMSNANFEKYLKIGGIRQTHSKEVFEYLSKVLNLPETEVILKLQEFPGSQNTTANNCKTVTEYLLKSGVTKKQLFNGLGVIVYDFDIVRVYFKDLPNRSSYQPFSEWTSHYNLVQLLIYTIEVDSGFKGCRVYGPKMKSDYSEKLVASHYSS